MAAFLLAPFYILVNIYLVHWMFRWMGACHYLFQTMIFRVLFTGIYIFLASTLLTGFLIKKPLWLHRLLKNIANYFLGTFTYILMVVAVVDSGRLLLKYIFHVSWIGLHSTFIITGGVCTLLILFLSAYGIIHTMKIKITPYEVTINKECGSMDSMKIVLIADTHFGYSAGAKHAERLAEKINAENPDLVCFAGDVFDNEFDAFDQPERLKNALKSIQSKYGIYACWGNHDLNEPILAGFTFNNTLSDKEDPRMEEFLTDCGIHLLDDKAELINDTFYIIGRKDLSRTKKLNDTRQTPAQLTVNLDRSKTIIFIDHQPKELDKISESGANLDLCGHTHNGQIFPGNLMIRFFWKNPCGYLKKDNMHNIVTSGAGVWGPNMRIGTDSEICSITVHFS